MSISCNQNDPQIVRYFADTTNIMQSAVFEHILIAVLVAWIFIGATASIIFAISHWKNIGKESLIIDWTLLLTSIGSGLLTLIIEGAAAVNNLEVGAFFIFAGWIISMLFLILATVVQKK